MLTLMLPAIDDIPAVEVHLEHSLASLSKWESKSEKAFFHKDGLTPEQTIEYIKTMALDPDLPENWIDRLSVEDFTAINTYINSRQSATWFREEPEPPGRREVVTAEIIYYWMISFNIPFQPCEDWHLNKLLSLVKVCGVKQTKPKKMSATARAQQFAALNAKRRQELGTTG